MNKEKLKHKLEQARMDRDLAVIQANKEIDRLEAELAEPEKPKLRHGDWWLTGKQICIYMKEFNGKQRDFVALRENIITNIGSDYQGEPILGNIFDLMKDWDEGFENVMLKSSYDSRAFFIQTSLLKERAIYLGAEDREKRTGVYLTISEAEEIWRNLGHAIMELKRKENKS